MAPRAPRNLKKASVTVYRKRADSLFRYKAYINGKLELDTPDSVVANRTPIVLTRKHRSADIKPMTLLELMEWEFMCMKPSSLPGNRPVLTRNHFNLDFVGA